VQNPAEVSSDNSSQSTLLTNETAVVYDVTPDYVFTYAENQTIAESFVRSADGEPLSEETSAGFCAQPVKRAIPRTKKTSRNNEENDFFMMTDLTAAFLRHRFHETRKD
ncbi:MAG: hypothetical protein IKD62_01285, partial [Oscillospiraceae bacterium]|nr:hypothetical protein [Oscillospiraceae bacterium]